VTYASPPIKATSQIEEVGTPSEAGHTIIQGYLDEKKLAHLNTLIIRATSKHSIFLNANTRAFR
jgi:hypothetical protein